jgi:type I restriction enzyme S subunit
VSGTVSSLASLSTLITKGTTPTTLGYAHTDSGIPFLRVQNIFGGQVNFQEDTLFIGDETHAALKRSQIQGGDVLVTIAGTIGRTGVVPLDAPSMNCNQAVAIVRPTAQIERSYLRHWLESQAARSQMIGSTVTGTISNLSLTQLGELKVPLLSLEEQRRIAAILDQAETLRTQRRQALAHLDTLTQSLFLEMFGDPMANPKGWSFVKLDQLVREGDTINYGVIQPGDALDEGVPLVRVGDVVDGNFDPCSLKRIDPTIEAAYKRSRLRGDEILVTCVGSIGVVALVDTSMRGFNIARAVSRIPVSDSVNRVFLARYLQTEHVQRYFTSELRTVSQPTLNIKQICETKVIQPPIALQQTFATRIQVIEALKATHRAALAQLDALFASLQQRAFAGEL